MTSIMRMRELPERLFAGAHQPDGGEMCLMEAVAYVAGEPWSDHPACVPLTLAAYGRSLNDWLSDDRRQELLRLVLPVIGIRRTLVMERRLAFFFADAAVHRFALLAFEAAELAEIADNLRALPAIRDQASAARAAERAGSAVRAAERAGSAARAAERAGSAARAGSALRAARAALSALRAAGSAASAAASAASAVRAERAERAGDAAESAAERAASAASAESAASAAAGAASAVRAAESTAIQVFEEAIASARAEA